MRTITQKYKFDYAHHLPDYNGKCARVHGHTGVLEVELRECQALKKFWEDYDGMMLDWVVMRRGIEGKVLFKIDHKNLNDILQIPTAENLLDWCVEKLTEYFGDALNRVRIYESENAYVTWTR